MNNVVSFLCEPGYTLQVMLAAFRYSSEHNLQQKRTGFRNFSDEFPLGLLQKKKQTPKFTCALNLIRRHW